LVGKNVGCVNFDCRGEILLISGIRVVLLSSQAKRNARK
jgi:hypothetical protein